MHKDDVRDIRWILIVLAIALVAIDHIRYPENISDYKMIHLTHVNGPAGECSLVSSDGMENVIVDEKDWYVMIGDSSLHKYYNAIIDYETLEYLGSVPIA